MAVLPLHRYLSRRRTNAWRQKGRVGIIVLAVLGAIVLPAPASGAPADSSASAPMISVHAPPLTDLVRRGRLARRPGRPRVALALSGGGARGIAQIGVLRALEDADIEIDLICGVSMGAIIGGLYASGISPDSLEALARDIRWGDMVRNTPPRAQLLLSQKSNEANWFVSIPIRDFRPQWPTGAISGQLLYNFLSQLTQGASYRCESDFDRLPIRYRAVATELVSGGRAVFAGGELAYAMRAAFAYPLAVTPLRDDSLLYADGGLVDPLPVQLAASLSSYPVVAVNTATGLTGIDNLTDPYAMANQATSVMTIPLIQKSLANADYVCTPNVGQTANFDFNAIDSLVAAGYAAGKKVADSILADARTRPSSLPDSIAHRQGPLALPPNMFEGDCPASVSLLLSTRESLTGIEVQRLLQREIANGWWDSAAVVYRAPNPMEPGVWELSARRPPVLTEVRFDSLHVFSADTLRSVVGLATGMRHDRWTIAGAINRIVAFYAVHNYTLTDVEDVTFSEDGVLTIRVDEALLDQLTLTGNRTVKSWVILRSFPMKEGRPYNARLVERGLNDLQATGLFEQITTAVNHSPEGPILHLNVTEKSTDALRLGLRHDLEYQTDVFVEWASINVLGLGNELVAHAQHAPRRDWFFLRAQASRVFRTYLTSALSLYRKRHDRHLYSDHEQNGGFETHRLGFELYFGQHITREAQLALLLDVEDLDLQVHGDSMSTNFDVARLAVVVRADDLDDRDFPTSGRRLTAQLRWADEFFGGDIVYRAFDGEGMWVESPTDRLTLLGSARFATAERHLPIFEQFSLGGLHSFMGLNEDEFFGDKLLQTSVMGRYQFFTRSYFTSRLDVGTVWAHNAQIDFFKDLLFGIGGGLMFDTPLGPLEIMGGLAEGGYTKFYFSWGYQF